jgi:8-amino-3,8-dideoxy-alpha-D-manno-octulosonate transaminase
MDLEQLKQVLTSSPPGFFGANVYDEQEIAAATRVIFNQSPFRFYGRKCTFEAQHFEEEAAAWYGVKHALTTNSGSGALLLALHALDIGPGCEVVVPGYFWIAVSNTILLRGGIPVICEVDTTLNMDPNDLRKKITPKTKAVVAVHMFGGQANMVEIAKVCREKKIPLIEDSSQCNGAAIGAKKLGSYGDIAITSLQLNKSITAGEGGMLLTDNSTYYEKAFARSDMGYPRSGGISSAEAKSSFVTIGEGRRFNEIGAAILRVQLSKLSRIKEQMSHAKHALEEGMKATVSVERRKVMDPAGDLGSTQTLIFKTAAEAEAYCAAGRKIFGDEGWFAGQLSKTGLHIYYNCSNLVQKIPVLPGGFPWNQPENKGDYHYEKGTCPATDALLERSVGQSIPPDLSPLQAQARVEAMNMAFQQMKH